MKIEDVINVCGQLPQSPPNLSNGNKKGDGTTFIGLLLVAVAAYTFYRVWKENKDSVYENLEVTTSDSETLE